MRRSSLALSALVLLAMALAACAPAATAPAPTAAPAPTIAPTAAPAPAAAPTAAPTTAPAPTAAPAPAPMDDAARLDALFTDRATNGLFSGSVLIVRGDEVLLRKGYGDADRAAGLANTPETVFRIGALTKPLTAIGILLLEAQGKLSVDDSICAYVDACPEAWEPITLHHLLSNTSGIPNYIVADQEARRAPEDLPAVVVDNPLGFVPGKAFALSQTNYALLGLVIERASGQPYETFMEQQIFAPLGMASTGYTGEPASLATGHRRGAPASPFNPSLGYAAYGLYSTVDDLYRLDRALLDGELLPAAQREQLLATQWDFGGFRFGYGVIMSDTYYAGHRLVGLGLSVKDEAPFGVARGYDSINYSLTDRDIYVVILANEEYAEVASLVEPVARMLLGEL